MGGQDDLVSSLRAIMAAKRDELGGPLQPEELVAYREGRLDPGERQRIEAMLAVDPDAARALADLAAFPAVEPAPGTPELSEEEIGARWQAFRERLPERSNLEASKKKGRRIPPAPFSDRLHCSLPVWLLGAVVLLAFMVGAGGGLLAGRRAAAGSGSAINASIVELETVDEGGLRSAAAPVELPEGSEELVLVLRARVVEAYPDYEVEITGPAGVRAWSRRGLRPTALGNFHLSFRRDRLKPGRYQLQLLGLEEGRRTRLAAYELRLDGGPAGR